MNQDQILLTSSDNFPLSEIQRQFGVVDSQIVIGANIFRDVFSSFRDVFGGETKGYKKDLDKLKKAAFQEIKKQAKEFGANAVISLRLDLDEVSGGGKSMFMLNAYGSAVSLKESVFKQEEKRNTINEISVDHIEYFKKRNNLT
ncbi:MAG: heavy metal-binding domain-containing protein [Balneolaceae bacterium]|nr:heavy metal-binding domain-containing protein [Balneolaceae bacterium]